MPDQKRKNVFNIIWKFFISVKLTIALLIVLSIVCIIGTVIPQNLAENEYLRMYSRSTYEFLKSTNCIDLYHAWWFTFLMTAFTANMIACSLNRLPRVLKFISKSDTAIDERDAENLLCFKKITFKTFNQEKAKGLVKALEVFLKKPETVEKAGKNYFFSEKGRFSYLAFYLTHLGMVIIIIGTLLGTLGFQGFMQLFEGDTSGIVTLRKSYKQKTLPFEIRCNKFEVTFYDRTNMPKDYKSSLTVIENGKEVLTKVIEVNDPLIYKGVYFYQSSYGEGAGSRGEVILGIKKRNSAEQKNYHVKAGQRVTIDGTKDTVKVNRLIPDFAMNDKGQPVSRSSKPNNPALLLTVFPEGKKPYSTWVFSKFPDFHKKPDSPYVFTFVKLFPKYYTGLQITRDPGIWVVWLGCTLITIGMCLAFFTSHRRVWMTVEEQGGTHKIMLAGTSNKNKDAFKKDFDRLFNELKSIGEMKC